MKRKVQLLANYLLPVPVVDEKEQKKKPAKLLTYQA